MRHTPTSSLVRCAWLVSTLSLCPAPTTRAQGAAPSFTRSSQTALGDRVAERAGSGRIASQILVGAVAAAAAGFTVWSLVDNPEGSDRRVKGDAGYTPNANTAYAVGSFVASTLGTYFVGRGDGSRASFGATALGAAIASVPIALGRHEPYLPIVGIVFGAPLQAIGATIGYQLTRRVP